MTSDDIIRMAREAGFRIDPEGEVLEGDDWHIQTDVVERFAALVAATEREECAVILDANANACVMNSTVQQVLKSNADAIRARINHD